MPALIEGKALEMRTAFPESHQAAVGVVIVEVRRRT
jgi:hypothetical protein